MQQIVPVGGRVKAASVGLTHLRADGADMDEVIGRLRKDPFPELATAFFPRTGGELKQALRGVGFYRPTLKTDQGMGGNFLPFTIDSALEVTDLSVRGIGHEEGHAIPERWLDHMNGTEFAVCSAFRKLDLKTTFRELEKLGARQAEKGRLPFFFIRPALPERPIVFGKDIVARVQHDVENVLEKCVAASQEKEKSQTGTARPHNFIYVQPDVFVLADGTVEVERINCPDVGFFLAGMNEEGSRVLPIVRSIVGEMCDRILNRILSVMGTRITLVTRDEVLGQQEDVLELREIDVLRRGLEGYGATVNVVSLSQLPTVEHDARVLLLNLNYRAAGIGALLERHAVGSIECFPNPFFQMACQHATGLKESVLASNHKHRTRFMQLTRSEPGSAAGRNDVLRHIDRALASDGIGSDIIHAVLPVETVPILRNSMHSWRQFAARAGRPENEGGDIRFRAIPATPENLILTSETGPRLHTFRFMYA